MEKTDPNTPWNAVVGIGITVLMLAAAVAIMFLLT